MGSFSILHWAIVLLAVVLVFGTKKLRNVGGDLGSAIRSFRKGLQEDEPEKLDDPAAEKEKATEPASASRKDS